MLEFLSESTFVTSIIAWFIAQFIKVIIVLIRDRKFDVERFVGSGGMPSAHSAFVVSLSIAVGITEGFGSAVFSVSMVLALIVMYDATGIRRAAGEQAKLLNQIVGKWGRKEFPDVELKELLGHTPYEVIMGALVGILVALVRHPI